MALPRELNLDTEVKAALIRHLDEELRNHDSERHSFLEEIKQWKSDYWAAPSTESATYPFENACTVVIPLTAIAVESIHARFMTSLFGLNELVTAKAKLPEFEAIEDSFSRYFDNYLRNVIGFRASIESPILETIKFGTAVAKSVYRKETRRAVRTVGEEEQSFDVVVSEGSFIEGVPLNRFLMPYVDQDPEKAQWCGEEHSETPYTVKKLEASGFFKPGTYEAIEVWVRNSLMTIDSQGNGVVNHQESLEKRETVWPKLLNWTQLWLSFDVDGDGKDEEIVIHYHRESQTLLSVRYNWHDDLRRGYRTARYFPVEYRWAGIGVAKQTEQFMREITTQHRQRIDNATIANCRMIAVNRNADITYDEKIYPGKIWYLDNVQDIQSVQLGDVYNSAYNNEAATMSFHQQRTGVNELTLGMQQAGTPGTATDTMQRVQEGNRRYDYAYSNVKDFCNNLVVDTACNLKQFGARDIEFYHRDPAKQQLVKAMFSLPDRSIREGLLLELRTTGQRDNKLLDRNNWQTLSQMLQQYYGGAITIAQTLQNPQLIMAILSKAFDGSNHAMRQMLETFDVTNQDAILIPPLQDLLKNVQSTGQPVQPPQQILGAGVAQGTN